MIKNLTKKKVLIQRTKIADSFLSRMIGLMFKRKLDYGLIFIFNIEKIQWFHTLFMFFPIDFLFLDSNKQVLKVIRNVKPWKININGKGKYIVEVLSGKSFDTQIGDKISFK